MATEVVRLARYPIHLGLSARASTLPEFDGTDEWYERYGAATEADGAEGRLVSMHTFTEPWTTWEVHPAGHEVVICTSGRLVLHQEIDGAVRTVMLESGEAAINPPGVWHTADVDMATTAVFITAGLGTQQRAR